MEIQQLKCLIAVCKYKSFTKAADAMFMSQSSISKIISSLEEEIGVSLIIRNRHKVAMTQAGQYLADHAPRVIQLLDKMETKTRRIGSGIDGFIQIGVCEELDINGLLPRFLKNFSMQNPSVEIDLSIQPMTKLSEMIMTGELDVAFLPNVVKLERPELTHIPINRAAPRLYFSMDHVKAKKQNLSINDFLGEQVLVLEVSKDDSLRHLEAMGYKFHSKLPVKSIQVMKLYIEANLGVAVLGTSQSFFSSTKVRHIPLPLEGYHVGTDAIYLTNSQNPVLELFVSNLNRYLENKPKGER